MPRLLLAGRPGQCHSEYLAPALLHGLENVRVFTFNAFSLHGSGADPLTTLSQVSSNVSPAALTQSGASGVCEPAAPLLKAEAALINCSMLSDAQEATMFDPNMARAQIFLV